MLLNEALDGIESHRADALGALEGLGQRTAQLPAPHPDFIEQVCGCNYGLHGFAAVSLVCVGVAEQANTGEGGGCDQAWKTTFALRSLGSS